MRPEHPLRARLVLATALAALVPAAGCGLVFDVDALGPGALADGEAGPSTPPDGALDGAATCPSLHGPSMIDADGECIDATEVTVAEYEPFTSARLALPLDEPCAWVTSFTPDDFEAQREHPDYPVVNVNFCHALHYCRWAGKRLCGSRGPGRGAVAPGDAGADPHDNQWLRACTHEGSQRYAYGSVLRASVCPTMIGPVKARTACAGAYPGLFDMLGNVGEWIDGCVTDGLMRARDGCTAMGAERVRGEATCYDVDELSRNAVSPLLGFRCCGL